MKPAHLFVALALTAALLLAAIPHPARALNPPTKPTTTQTATRTRCRVSIVGAGFGGLYAAYRLLTDPSSPYLAADICVWEKENRVGGRALTLSKPDGGNVFPMRSRVSLGAHRWSIDYQPLIDSVITKVLNLNSACYSQTPDCMQDGASHYNLRNGAYDGDLSSSEVPGFPYFLDADEEWVNFDQPNPVASQVETYSPAYYAYIDDIAKVNPNKRYPALKAATDAVRTFAVDGALPNALTGVLLTNFTDELWNLYITEIGESLYFQQLNSYDVTRDSLDFYVGDRLKVITDAQGYELGFQWKDISLANLLISKGVGVHLNKEVAGVVRTGGSYPLTLRFADGSVVTSQKVLLNIAVTQLLQLSHDSVVFTEASPQLLQMYKLVQPTSAVKAYGYYPNAWWPARGITEDEFSTTLQANYFDARDSAVECPGLPPGPPSEQASAAGAVCKGWINMAYPDGDYYRYFKYAQQDGYSPQVVVRRDTADPALAKWFWDLNHQFVTAVCNSTGTPGAACDIPAPEVIAVGVWDQAWHDIKANSRFVGGYVNNATLVLADGVFWGNEANSRQQGWAEGSGWAMEQILHFYFGFNRPPWLGSKAWYDNIIDNPLF
jgi:hypothetical protein